MTKIKSTKGQTTIYKRYTHIRVSDMVSTGYAGFWLLTNTTLLFDIESPGGSMSQVVGLPNNAYKPITNTAWVRARLCKLQKSPLRCTRLAAASEKVYQLLAHGRWFSPGTPGSSTTKTGRHDLAESDVKHNKINQSINQHFILKIKLQQIASHENH